MSSIILVIGGIAAVLFLLAVLWKHVRYLLANFRFGYVVLLVVAVFAGYKLINFVKRNDNVDPDIARMRAILNQIPIDAYPLLRAKAEALIAMREKLNEFLKDKLPLVKAKIETLRMQQNKINETIEEYNRLKSEIQNDDAIALFNNKIRQLEEKNEELSNGIDAIYLSLERIYAIDKVSGIKNNDIKIREITEKADELITEAKQIQTDINSM